MRGSLERALALTLVGPGQHVGTMPSGCLPRTFGGAQLAHAIVASAASAPEGFVPYTLHTTFLQPGNPLEPTLHLSSLIRRTHRFATVRVDSRQGQLLATSTVSFHVPRPSSSHGEPRLPSHPGPDEALPATGGPIPDVDAPTRAPFDFREGAMRTNSRGRPVQGYWLRAREEITEESAVHAAGLAWASDFALTRAADLEHEGEPGNRQAASLDHAMWLHRPIELDQWMYYEVTSPIYRDELALSTAEVRDRSGNLMATIVQESLLRRR